MWHSRVDFGGLKYFDYKLCAGRKIIFYGNFGFLQRVEEVGDDGSRADRGLILGGLSLIWD